MAPESWLKVALPGFPVAFTIFGTWLYWGDNPLPLLAPPVSFWGVVLLYYLFTHLAVPNRNYPLILVMAATALWVVTSITSHNLGRFLSSGKYTGPLSVLSNRDFWYAYICGVVGCVAGLGHFLHYEPLIMEQVRQDRASLRRSYK